MHYHTKLPQTKQLTMTRFTLLITIFAILVAIAHAGMRPEDAKWLEAKAKEEGVVATGSGLLYKGASFG